MARRREPERPPVDASTPPTEPGEDCLVFDVPCVAVGVVGCEMHPSLATPAGHWSDRGA